MSDIIDTKKLFHPEKFESKWQSKWESDKVFTPDLTTSKNPYFNLMMFPYPSAEGLHVGNMYAFTGADVYARLNRMKGKDVFEPIGLDGFGIHSENYALKVGRNPKEQSAISQANFYRQLRSIGNSFDWERTLETYDPKYFRWTQWLFIQLFKAGLAYRKKAEVNWCPSCMTVLSDEQVIDEKCERCGSVVEKKNLEQWFFRITEYAERLLQNIEGLDWSKNVKTAQTNWIGKSTGAVIKFNIAGKYRFINLHGFTGTPRENFFPWLEESLKKQNHEVITPELPDTEVGNVEKQVQYVIDNNSFDENTVLLGHSLGSVVALKVIERLQTPIKKLVLVAGFAQPGFLDHKRPFEDTFDWTFDFEKIKENAGEVVLLRAINDTAVPQERSEYLQQKIGGKIITFNAVDDHITGITEPEVLKAVIPSLDVFTTRPDTLYGATFIVIAPEHPRMDEILRFAQDDIKKLVSEYIKLANSKSNIERTDDTKEKTGVFSGLYAINPATHKEIPIWIADYVLSGYGTGAIMAVPAHDTRDYEFAKKYDLSIVEVIAGGDISKEAYTGSGKLINSGEWDGFIMPSSMSRVISYLEEKYIGSAENQYHLRDWLISRQRYWGPPIPMIHCIDCEGEGKGERTDMPGWYSVELNNLPVLLPDVSDWKPLGTGKSPLANHPEFYNVTCPACGKDAIRETDVSDTFLDSAWYFLGYISDVITGSEKETMSKGIDMDQDGVTPWDKTTAKSWLPVAKYIGGAEHSVLHLLYSRFISMVLHDLKFTQFEEPFQSFYAHGLIVKDGAKMSKSKGNVVVPDEYINKYGADTLRAYLMFLGPFSDGGDFRDSGIEGMHRFIKRVWNLAVTKVGDVTMSDEGYTIMHKTIKKVTEDIEAFKYNTAIASLMEWYNFLSVHKVVHMTEMETFLKLLAPFAPFMTEELWNSSDFRVQSSEFKSIHLSSWPAIEEKYLVSTDTLLIIQVNGKKRAELLVQSGEAENKEKVESQAREMISKHLEGIEVKKVIHVHGKIINFVI